MKAIYKKVYILVTKNSTGGVELAHQLIHKLTNLGQQSYIVYVDDGQISRDQTIIPEYHQYNVQSTDTIEDDCQNYLIIPEVFFNYIPQFKKINIGCWWMSVDNRYNNACVLDTLKSSRPFKKKLAAIWFFKYRCRNISDKDIRKLGERITHFYQSIYAMRHLYNKGFYNICPLGDYINTSFIDNNEIKKRDNLVLYNPAKGYEYTKKIIANSPDVEFIALKGFSRIELLKLMRRSKVYIDFGNFPGKDRLPREAALNGNIVLTGTKGASGYYGDVPIPSKYKFKVRKESLNHITKMIRTCLDNYESMNNDFDLYRRRIFWEEIEFENQIKEFFFHP